MEKKPGDDLQTEAAEGGLKELVLRWFTETQAALVLNGGNFPDWFLGFAARKDAEDLLKDKALGCFLIRLSDKAIGYILSYRGHDRCRHFVITQKQDGQFVIAGDCQTYRSLAELIEHYKVSPIQPFGECLTSSCHEENTGELYDVVNCKPKERSGVSVQALRILWDQINDRNSNAGNNQRAPQQSDPPKGQPPALPPKSKSRKLTGTVSVDAMSLSQGVPPVPKRSLPLGYSLSGSLPDKSPHPAEPQPDPGRAERPRGNATAAPRTQEDCDPSRPEDPSPPGTAYSEAESRGESPPEPDEGNSMQEEEEEEEEGYSNRLSASASYSPAPMKRVTCQTYSLHEPGASGPEPQGDAAAGYRSNPLYHTAEGPGGAPAPQGEGMYAEVPQRLPPAALPDDTYEQIPGEAAAAVQGNMYESLDDMRTKKSKSTWGKNNMKWKKFLPDYMKK